tara:strand:- start:403 stop:1881 length:1479 start_codon:yes stop_codon:yes gene_type:complete
MASLTDDLRYLSRAGYRDPWAEATNNISNNLFELANIKMKRDVLLAELDDKRNREEARAKKESFENSLQVYNATSLDFKKDAEINLVRHARDVGVNVNPIIESNKEILRKRNQRDTLLEPTGDILTDYKNAQEAYDNADTASDQSFVGNVLNKRKIDYNNLLDRNNTNLRYKSLEERGFVTEQDAEMFDKLSTNNNTAGMKNYVNTIVNKNASDISVIEEAVNNYKKYINQINNEFGAGSKELESITAEFQSWKANTFRYFPPQYQNAKDFEKGLFQWKMSRTQKDKPKNGVNDPPLPKDPPKTEFRYNAINDIPNEDVLLPPTAMVSLMNPENNQPYNQKFSGTSAVQMINSGKGQLIKESAMSPLELTISDDSPTRRAITYQEPQKPGMFNILARGERRHKRIDLQDGDTVINKSTNKRTQVFFEYSTAGAEVKNFDQIKFRINGKRLTWQEFTRQYGKPLYEKEEIKVPQMVIDDNNEGLKVISIEKID